MTTDLSLQRLYPLLNQADEHSIWIADEHVYSEPLPSFKGTAITNRHDTFTKLKAAGIQVLYNDFDFSSFSPKSCTAMFYRVSKEKPVVHWAINNASKLLKTGSSLYLSGEKNDGLKTYADKAGKRLGEKAGLSKDGNSYLAELVQTDADTPNLDDKDYTQLRLIKHSEAIDIYSKPGVFGWDKIDRGSHFLVQHLPQALQRMQEAPSTLLDLGCGYGYLSLMAHFSMNSTSINDSKPTRIVATDNNATAITACRKNFQRHQINGEVIADSCAESIREKFDLILCNPPFHQGFDVESQLTKRFLQATQQRLSNKGAAFFVVNQFIPLEKLATGLFKSVKTLENNGSFKLILLS